MNLSKATMIGVDIWHENQQSQAMASWLSLPESKDLPTLTLYRPDGTPISASVPRTTAVPLQDFWQRKVMRRLIFAPRDILDEYSYWIACVDLDLSTLPEILTAGRAPWPFSWSKTITDLFDSVFPSPISYRVPATDSLSKYSYILYLEPDTQVFDPTVDDMPRLRTLAYTALDILKISKDIACIPHLLMDCLVLPGISWLRFEDELVAFSIKPMQAEKELHHTAFPKSVFQLAEYLASIRIFQELENRLERLPFFKMDVREYVRSLDPTNSPGDYYGKVFLKDRLTVGAERLTVSQLARTLSTKVDSNYVSRSNELRGSLSVQGFSQHPLRYNLLDHIRDSLRKFQSSVDEALLILQVRETALADYLRDIAVHNSTRANLLLQRSIRRLTLLAVVLALLGLAIALTP